MKFGFHVGVFALTACLAASLDPVRADDTSWVVHADVQYGELARGNRSADPNLVSLDVYVPEGLAEGEALPLVVMFHGGGWRRGDKADVNVVQNKIPFFTANGFVFASANYELSPAVRYPVHVQDVARAVAFLYENAADYHIDRGDITLMGHSAGAQLVALAAVDDRFFREAGRSTDIVSRVILLDGIYDLPFRLRTDDRNNKQAIHEAFGANPLTLLQASPVYQVKDSRRFRTPPMLNFFSDVRSKVESDLAFIRTLRAHGIAAGGILCRKFSHPDVDRLVGAPGSPMNQPILDFLGGADPQALDGIIVKPEVTAD